MAKKKKKQTDGEILDILQRALSELNEMEEKDAIEEAASHRLPENLEPQTPFLIGDRFRRSVQKEFDSGNLIIDPSKVMEQKDIDAFIKSICDSPYWDERAGLELTVDWKPLAESEWPSMPGLYALGWARGICYDSQHSSRIIYIGISNNLSKRLRDHSRKPHNRHIDYFAETFPDDGLLATAWPFTEGIKPFLDELEYDAGSAFERQFGSLPVANLQQTGDILSGYWLRGLTRIVPEDLPCSMGLYQLAEQFGVTYEAETPWNAGRIFFRKIKKKRQKKTKTKTAK